MWLVGNWNFTKTFSSYRISRKKLFSLCHTRRMIAQNSFLLGLSHQSICKVIADMSIFFLFYSFFCIIYSGYCLIFFLIRWVLYIADELYELSIRQLYSYSLMRKSGEQIGYSFDVNLSRWWGFYDLTMSREPGSWKLYLSGNLEDASVNNFDNNYVQKLK